MSIKLSEYSRKLPGTRYDSQRKRYIGYAVDVTIAGKRMRSKRFPTKTEAERFIETAKQQNQYKRNGLKPPVTANAASIRLAALITARVADFPKGTRRNLVAKSLTYLLDITGEFICVTDVTFEHLKAYHKCRLRDLTPRGTRVSETTIRREMTEISSVLKAAAEYFPELANYKPPKIPRPAIIDIRRERKISRAERSQLIEYYNRPRQSNEGYKQYLERLRVGHGLEFAWLTGSRRKEVVKLKRTAYSKDRDELKIIRWKTARSKKNSVSVFSPVPVLVRELIEKRIALEPDNEYLFSQGGRDSAGYLKSLRKACKHLDIAYGRYTEGGLTFHDAKHTFISDLLESGTDLETTRELAGLTREMVLHYAHSSPESRAKAAETIDKLNGRKSEVSAVDLSALTEKLLAGHITKQQLETEILKQMTTTRQVSKTATA